MPHGKFRLIAIGLLFYSLACLAMVSALTNTNLVITTAPTIVKTPDFASMESIPERKQAFFEFLVPYIHEQNQRQLMNREQLLVLQEKLYSGKKFSKTDNRVLTHMATLYRVDSEELSKRQLIEKLLRRADEIPPGMVLAQAATESAWGTSRFASTANNFFGQWCFVKGCGVVPNRRAEGLKHEVAKFRSVAQSVASYFRNINTHNAYREIRQRRAQLRATNQPVMSVDLIQGLTRYSERGQAYIDELRDIIVRNNLSAYRRPENELSAN